MTVLVTVGSLYSIIFPKTALPPIVLMGERFLETGFLYTLLKNPNLEGIVIFVALTSKLSLLRLQS